ncbi:MAG: hypothetical protein KBC05_19780 [Candidatus Hydrogenedentes bacterium]|nr:hypothetical protein [Candidatus Hydrogenedentota bacterium]
MWTIVLLATVLAADEQVQANASLASDPIYLISGVEQTIEPTPVIVYRLTSDTRLELVKEISPEGGVRMLRVNPEEHALAVWRYKRRARGEKRELVAPGAGSVYWFDLTKPADHLVFELPIRPVLGGFFVASDLDSIGLITEGVYEESPVAISVVGGNVERVPFDKAPWDKTRYWGGTPWLVDRQVIVAIDPVSGQFTRVLGLKRSPLSFGLQGELLAEYRGHKEAWDAISGPGKWTDAQAGIVVNTVSHMLLVLFIDRMRPDGLSQYAVFDKQTSCLRWFVAPVTKPFVHELGNYWVFGEWSDEYSEWGRRPTGQYFFFDFEGKQKGRWETTSDTEILLFEQDEVIYRRDKRLFRAPFDDGNVDSDREQLILEDDRLLFVHRALLFP